MKMISDHEKRLARLLLNPEEAETLLNRALAPNPASSPRCALLDAKYQPGRHCIAQYHYQGGYVTLVVCFAANSPFCEVGQAVIDSQTGIRIYPFPNDPALPGLVCAADPAYLSRILAAVLQKHAQGCRIVACRPEPVRYRSCQRCTFAVEVTIAFPDGKDARQRFFVKVFDDPQELETVYRAMQQLAVSRPGENRVDVPAPLIRIRPQRILVQREAKGACLERLLTASLNAGANIPRDLQPLITGSAAGLAAIHGNGIKVDRKRDLTHELRELSQWARDAGLIDPSLSAEMGRLVSDLWACKDIVASIETSAFTHGDFKPNQILVDGQQISFLDFDGCAMSDRAIDVATFVSTLRQIAVRQALNNPVSAAALGEMQALENSFMDHYCMAACEGHRFRRKVKWCQALALLRKALRAFHRDPASPLAAGIIREAHRFLRDALIGGCRPIPGRS